MNVGDRIKILRKSQGLSQDEFAQKLGLSQGFISNVEKSRVQFTLEHIISIANIFKVDLNWLIAGEEKPLVAETQPKYGRKDVVKEKINQMLDGLDEEKKRDILKYTEEKKQLAELLAERESRKAG